MAQTRENVTAYNSFMLHGQCLIPVWKHSKPCKDGANTSISCPRGGESTMPARLPASQPAVVEDDDFVSANGDDPEEQDQLYEFLDAVSVASRELRGMRSFQLCIALWLSAM